MRGELVRQQGAVGSDHDWEGGEFASGGFAPVRGNGVGSRFRTRVLPETHSAERNRALTPGRRCGRRKFPLLTGPRRRRRKTPFSTVCGRAGGPGIRSLAHARRCTLLAHRNRLINTVIGTQTQWQRRMGPPPGRPIHHPKCVVGAPTFGKPARGSGVRSRLGGW